MNRQVVTHIWDLMLKSGEVSRVRHSLLTLEEAPARSCAAEFADLARRAGLPNLGVEWLYPWVKPNAKTVEAPSETEKAVYASCLSALGAVDEAIALLNGVDRKAEPRADLFLAQTLIRRWDYQLAIAPLLKFIANPSGEYDRLVAQLNLASCYLFVARPGEADEILKLLRQSLVRSRYRRLFGQAVQLQAMTAIARRDGEAATVYLNELEAVSHRCTPVERLLQKKWRALANDVKSPGTLLSAIPEIRQEAQSLGHWETVRDCDRHEALATKNSGLFLKLLLSTPYAGYRQQLTAEFAAAGMVAKEEGGSLTLGAGPSRGSLDLSHQNLAALGLKPGSVSQRLLLALTSEGYRPLQTAQLFAALYDGERFNPKHSPVRVHTAISRLREWLRDSEIPFEIVATEGGYRAEMTNGSFTLVMALKPVSKKEQSLMVSLQKVFKADAFTSPQAAEKLSLPERTIRRHLANAAESGQVERLGSGRTTLFRFAA